MSINIISIEKAVLSTIIYDYEALIIEEVALELKPDDFSNAIHKEIYRAILELYKNKETIDDALIINKINKKIASEDDVIEIMSYSSIANINSYVKVLKQNSIKKALNKIADEIHLEANDNNTNIENILDNIQKNVFRLSTETIAKDFRNSEEVGKSTLDQILERKKK